MNNYVRDIKNSHILVVGLGKSGMAVIEELHKMGAIISLQDAKDEEDITEEQKEMLKNKQVKCYFNSIPEDMGIYSILVLSPGVPTSLEFIKEAEDKGAEVIGELEFAYRCGDGKYIAITGTNGKTTTTTLVGEILKNENLDARIVGNIGKPVITEAMKSNENTWLVTETSSFQLETIKEFRPFVSAILNLTSDHMDRHKTIENYGKAKARIMMNQSNGDYIIINFDDKKCLELISGVKAKVVPFSRLEKLKFGIFVKDEKIVVRNEEEKIIEICEVSDLKIPGTHNLENALAAVGITYFGGVSVDTIKNTLINFEGVCHRLEFVREVKKIKFVNDSKGTNTDAAIKAVEAIDSPIILIAGGYDKNADFENFIDSFGDKVKHMILLGATAGKLKATAERRGYKNTIIVKDMDSCVNEAFRLAEGGSTVLLSPACASWDMYKSFEERGEDFKRCVNELRE